ncbi:secondary thiamine-phosphate synthase [Globicatella sp. HMSC072A10]|uniref:YjbQ family protein n=1 Tax=Globicatella sp. HMSC072A10 TaxID=1739315 RepID=UPI0008BFF031|nr:YjbQ family protein [Globicatella sp. HMSC072A10]OFK58231.1 secondary thiamine-phosphate synthase [Globicatella sp. HMSC072A10]
MKVHHNQLTINTVAGRPSYHDIRKDILNIVDIGGIKNGVLIISSPHTTCSLFFEETMHDTNYFGDDYLHVDINNIMESLVPKMASENQYNSPGPKHIEFGTSLSDPNYPAEKWVMLNTDAHLRSSIYGTNSMSLIIKDGKLLLGDMGRVYFVDWDQLRERIRTINIMIMGE